MVKTIELSSQESALWNAKSSAGAALRRNVQARENARAARLGMTVELYGQDGRLLAHYQPDGSVIPASPDRPS